jgi:hypothetical protein
MRLTVLLRDKVRDLKKDGFKEIVNHCLKNDIYKK